MVDAVLPNGFGDLAPWVADWALGNESERNRKRITSTMDELRAFYDAVLPRVEAAMLHLKPIAFDALSPADRNLLHLSLMFMEVAGSIEVFFAVDVPNSFEPERFHILPPFMGTAVTAAEKSA